MLKSYKNDVVYIIDYFDPKYQIWYGPREFDNLKTAKAAFEIYKENFSVQLTKVERHFEVLDFCQKISHESS